MKIDYLVLELSFLERICMAKNPLRVLFAYRSDVDASGGAAGVMNQTGAALKKLGVRVEISHDLYPDTRGFDAVHAFNIWSPPTALCQLKYLRKSGLPVIWSPFYLHWCECAWANLAFQLIYRQQKPPAEREKILQAFAAGTLDINGLSQWKPNEIYPGFHQALKEMLLCVDHLCAISHSEIQKLAQITGSVSVPYTLTPHGVDFSTFSGTSEEPFCSRFGTRDFVLCVGSIDHRKNQLMLIEALKGENLPIVLIGPSFEPEYINACKKEGGTRVLVTGRLGPDLVASAYRGAAVHALPSFAEGAALANLEAAVSECAMVVGNRSSEFEYFGDAPFYCSPNDPASIREAVLAAIESRAADPGRWKELGRRTAEKYTWENTAELTLEAYERALRKKERLLSSAPLPRPLPQGEGEITMAPVMMEEASVNVSPVPVLWSGPVFDASGYADVARSLIGHMGNVLPLYIRPAGNHDSSFVAGMDPAEYHSLAQRQKTPDPGYISLLSMPAYAFQKDPNAAYNIGRTVFETDRISPEWVLRCNLMDEVWVPTEFNLKTFRNSGVTAPIFVIPEGVDPDFYRPGPDPMPIPGRRGFAFLSVFKWEYRKGWDILLKSWSQAFSRDDDVCLVLRTYGVKGANGAKPKIGVRVRDFFESIGKSETEAAPVILLEDQVPQHRMPNLYAAADAFVLPSRGEGWGRPYMEAMSCALPVIGTGWGGSLAFMNGRNSYLIEIKGLDQVEEKMELPFSRGHLWSSPSGDHLAALMKEVFSNRRAARQKAQRARQDVIEHWHWEKAAAAAFARIREISAKISVGATRRDRTGTRSRSPQYEPAPVTTSAPRRAAPSYGALCVRWEGLQFAWHSLALINRELCLALIDAGHQVSILRFLPEEFGAEKDPRFKKLAARVRAPLSRPADIHVRHHFPPDFTPPPEGRWVMVQPWEYGRLPEEWVAPMSALADEIWVPSRYVMKSYIASGVPSDLVRVVPNGVNPAIFNPRARPYPLPTGKKFKFLFVGGLIWRKGFDVLLNAYRSAFSKDDDVALVVKEMGQSNVYQGLSSSDSIENFRKDPGAPEIVHITEMIGEEQMAGLFRASDCLVHPYRGEGFALPVLEAQACGIPVAVTAGGATDDFCSEKTAFLIPSKPKGFYHKEIKFAGGPGWVLEPDAQYLPGLLRHIVESPGEAGAKARCALDQAGSRYSWSAVSEVVFERMRALAAKPVRRNSMVKAACG